MKKHFIFALTCVLAITSLSSCSFLLGKKNDDQVKDVLKQGAIDPNNVPNTVGYVPVLPAWGGFLNPHDVYVGYDEMVYVCDDRGVNVLDQKGTIHRTINIRGAKKVVQDRRLITYVVGRVDYDIAGVTRDLAAVYVIQGISGAAAPIFLDTLIHPFNDNTRNNTNFRGAIDEQVQFTGVTTLANNAFYISRTGPSNSALSTSIPDNSVLLYDNNFNNTGFARGLSSTSSSLKSCMNPTGIASFCAPPQAAYGLSASEDFLLLQGDPGAEYKVLWLKKFDNPDSGPEFVENQEMLSFDQSKASRFLYDSYRFTKPADICVAPDETKYIFVVDEGKDSVFQFTAKGFEGVNPPATFGTTKQIPVSFGGTGSGPGQFKNPQGIAYFKRTLYVADTGNGRIVRFKLSTDLER